MTTLLCGCDPVFPIFLSGTANREKYYPEFVSGYEQDFIGQLGTRPSSGSRSASARSVPTTARSPRKRTGTQPSSRMSDDEPAFSVDGLYYQIYMSAIGVQMGRSDLTPETFEQGDVRLPRAPRSRGAVGLGPQDYTPMDDYHEMYWDTRRRCRRHGPSRRLESTRTPGKRYRHAADELPPGEPRGPRRVTAPSPTRSPGACRADWSHRWRSSWWPRRTWWPTCYPAPGRCWPATRRSRWSCIGIVYGTVTALGAMALILVYRANRFVNFAHGAMGSVVGVLAIGLYREHDVPFPRRPGARGGGRRGARRHESRCWCCGGSATPRASS